MAMADNTEDNDPFEEDIVFDQAGLLGGRMPRSRQQATVGFLPTFMLFIRTVILCVAFLAMGLCTSVSGGPLIKLEITVGTEESLAFHMYSARSAGMLVGGFLGALLFEVYNRQFLMFISLVWTAVSVTVLPFTVPVSLWWTFCSAASLGIGLGFFFTGGNVLCLDLWGQQGGASLQSIHFSFALGAFIAPLVIHPFFVGPFPAETLNRSLASGDLPSSMKTVMDQNGIRIERALQEYSKDYGYEDYIGDFVGDAETSRVRRDVLANDSLSGDDVTSGYDDTTVNPALLSTLKAKEPLAPTTVSPKGTKVSNSSIKGETTELGEEMGHENVTHPPVTTVHPRKPKPLKTYGNLLGTSNLPAEWESPASVSAHEPAIKNTEAEKEHKKSTVPPVKTSSPVILNTEAGDFKMTTPASIQTDAPSIDSVQVIDNTPSSFVPSNATTQVNVTLAPLPSNTSAESNFSLSNRTTEVDSPDLHKTVSNTSVSSISEIETTVQTDTKIIDVGMTTTTVASTQKTSQSTLTADATSSLTTTTAFKTDASPTTTTAATTTDESLSTSEANRNTTTFITPPSTFKPALTVPAKEGPVSHFTTTSVKEDERTTAPPVAAGMEDQSDSKISSPDKEEGSPVGPNDDYKTGGEGEPLDVENKNEAEEGGVPLHSDSEHEMGDEGDPQDMESQEGSGGKKLADVGEQEPQQTSDAEPSLPDVVPSHLPPEKVEGQQGNQSNSDSSEETIPGSQNKEDQGTTPHAFKDSALEPDVEPVMEPADEPGTTAPPLPADENAGGNHNSFPGLKPGTYSDESEENHQFLDNVAHRFKNYGVTKIHLAYISIGIFVVLNSFVSVVVLCHNPREPRSKQDDGTLDEVHKGRMILFVVMFSMFMFMGEALQGAVHHLLTLTSTGTGLEVIEESGIDGQLLFWGLVCIVRFLCIFISGCLRLKPGKLLGSSALFTVIGTVFLAVGSFGKEDFLWAGIIVVALGLAPILPTSLLWMAQHMRVTHRMCALMIILASTGNSLTHSLLTHVLGSSHLYAYILVTVSFISMLFLLISMCVIYTAQQSKSLGVPVGYQLANQHEEEDVLEMTPADSAVFNRNHHLVRENGESGQSLLLE